MISDRCTRRCLEEAEIKLGNGEPNQRTGAIILAAFRGWLEDAWEPHNERDEELRAALNAHLNSDVPEIQERLSKIEDALFNDENGLVHIRRWLCTVSRWAAALVVAMAGFISWIVELWTRVPIR